MEQIYDVVIIGGGPAGYTAALYSSRAGLATVLIERLSPGGQMALTGDIENYPGFPDGIDGFTLGMNMQQGAERFGAKTEYAEVIRVDFSKKIKEVETTSGIFFGKTVIICSGADPRRLGVAGEEKFLNRGVHYCAHCDGRFYKDKTVAVIGGGNSAAADASYLSRLAKKVYIIHRRDTLRATKIYHEPLMKAENVEFLWNSTVESFIGNDKFAGVEILNTQTGNKSIIECDGAFVSIGRQPSTAFLSDSVPLDQNGYVVADETTKTAISGVFAAGDVRAKTLRQVVTAVSDGAIAADQAEHYLNQIQ